MVASKILLSGYENVQFFCTSGNRKMYFFSFSVIFDNLFLLLKLLSKVTHIFLPICLPPIDLGNLAELSLVLETCACSTSYCLCSEMCTLEKMYWKVKYA